MIHDPSAGSYGPFGAALLAPLLAAPLLVGFGNGRELLHEQELHHWIGCDYGIEPPMRGFDWEPHSSRLILSALAYAGTSTWDWAEENGLSGR